MINDFGFWLANNLDMADLETLRDEGAIAGIPGMVYYGQTSDLYDRFSHDIWTAVVDYSDANGFKVNDIVSNIITAECDSHRHFANNMVWFAAEYYVDAAIKFVEERDQEEEDGYSYISLHEEEEEEGGPSYITLD